MLSADGELGLLMQYCEGHLDAERARRLGERLENDSKFRQRYQLVQHVSQEPAGRLSPALISAELLAAFVEGSLDAKAAARVEEACWQSAATLSEALSAYRFLSADAPPQQPPGTLTQRLLAIKKSSHETDHPADPTPVNGAVRTARQTEFATRERQRRKTWPVWAVTAAAVLLVAVVGTLVVRLGSPASVEVVRPRQPERETWEHDAGGEVVDVEPWDEPFRDLPEQPPARHPAAPGANPPQDQIVSPSGSPRPSPAAPLDQTPYEPAAGGSLNLEWNQIEGLLAVHSRTDDRWLGAGNERAARGATEFATFPGSWAESKAGRLGRLILADDTAVSVAARGTTSEVDLELIRGRVAMCDLAPGVVIRMKVGAAQWSLTASRPNSTVGIQWDRDVPLILLRDGEVSVNGRNLAAGREAVWTDGQFSPRNSETNSRWIDPPSRSVRLSTDLQARLLSSQDLRSDLADIRRTGPGTARLLTTRWALALFPAESTFDSLGSDDQRIRLETLNWLIASTHPPDVRQRLAWRSLAVSSGDAATVRQIYSWAQKTPQGRRAISSAEADHMVRLLDHPELAFRQAAIFFLEGFFGKRVKYDPTAAAAIRHRAAQQWRRGMRDRR